MRQLHTCDFCGDDPTGVYEVVPAALDPTEDEQRRVALCADCHETLDAVLAPLLTRLGGSDSTPAASSNPARAEPGPSNAAAPRSPESEADPESGADSAAVTGAADAEEPASTSGPSNEERETTQEEAGRTAPRADRPPGYAKVLRLLQNRDDAIPRGDLEALATNAYELDPGTFETIVDAAVENGDLEESTAGLRTT